MLLSCATLANSLLPLWHSTCPRVAAGSNVLCLAASAAVVSTAMEWLTHMRICLMAPYLPNSSYICRQHVQQQDAAEASTSSDVSRRGPRGCLWDDRSQQSAALKPPWQVLCCKRGSAWCRTLRHCLLLCCCKPATCACSKENTHQCTELDLWVW